MYEPAGHRDLELGFLWPALVASSASAMAAAMARLFADFAVGLDEPDAKEPEWTTPHTIALELESVRLRDFTSHVTGFPTVLCTPFALHGAAISDLAADHSLVAALRAAGRLSLCMAQRLATLPPTTAWSPRCVRPASRGCLSPIGAPQRLKCAIAVSTIISPT